VSQPIPTTLRYLTATTQFGTSTNPTRRTHLSGWVFGRGGSSGYPVTVSTELRWYQTNIVAVAHVHRRGGNYWASPLTRAMKTEGSRVAAGTTRERTAGRAVACSAAAVSIRYRPDMRRHWRS
jgi:hypothetical protein